MKDFLNKEAAVLAAKKRGKKGDFFMTEVDGNWSTRYFNTRGLLSLLAKRRAAEVKWWQGIPPHYTDLIVDQLETQRKMRYLEALANHSLLFGRGLYRVLLPLVGLSFGLLCFFLTPVVVADIWAFSPWAFRLLFCLPIAFGFFNVPFLLQLKRRMHDISYRSIQDPLGQLIFTYFEPVDFDKNATGGYTRAEILEILKKHHPELKVTALEIADYLQKIWEVEVQRKPRGYVYYLSLRATK